MALVRCEGRRILKSKAQGFSKVKLPVDTEWIETGMEFELDDSKAAKLCSAIGCFEIVGPKPKPEENADADKDAVIKGMMERLSEMETENKALLGQIEKLTPKKDEKTKG